MHELLVKSKLPTRNNKDSLWHGFEKGAPHTRKIYGVEHCAIRALEIFTDLTLCSRGACLSCNDEAYLHLTAPERNRHKILH